MEVKKRREKKERKKEALLPLSSGEKWGKKGGIKRREKKGR